MNEYDIELYKIIGGMIREIRVAKGYTLDDIADMIEVTRKTVQRYETGERKIRIATLMRLSELLGFDYYEFTEQAKRKLITDKASSQPNNIGQVRRVMAYASKLDELYKNLNEENKNKVLDFALKLYEIQQMEIPLLNAASPLPGATDEDKEHDDKIMDDDNF